MCFELTFKLYIMCNYATYCPEDNVTYPCNECILCLNSQEDIDIAREINEFDTKANIYDEKQLQGHEEDGKSDRYMCDDDLPF
jgi:hypothetical protein